MGVCHGDFGGGNASVDATGPTAFDFDLCGPGWRAFDLAAIQLIASSKKNPAIWDVFVSGYQERRSLSPADLAAATLFCPIHRLWRLGLQAEHAQEWGVVRLSDAVMDRELRAFRTWRLRMALPEPIAVIRSIVSPDALLAKVVQSYAIASPVRCRLLKRGLNDTYLLTTEGGPYVLRVYRAGWRSGDEIQYELDLLRHLHVRGVAVSVPIAAHGDRLALPVAAPEGIRYLVLFTYANGSRARGPIPAMPTAWALQRPPSTRRRTTSRVRRLALRSTSGTD